MQDEDQSEPLPAPIDGGRVTQVIVEYTGAKLGSFRIRGHGSRRAYAFDASTKGKRQYVLEEDLDLFRRHTEFRVLEESRIDPEAEERERREARMLTRVAKLLDDHEKRNQRRPSQRHGGRPPVPVSELQRLWHLRHHCLPAWSIAALAVRFIPDDYATPEATVKARLYRLKKFNPVLTNEDGCPWCAQGYAPEPPARGNKTPTL